MLNLRPLDKQMVHPRDSVLGPLSRARLARPLDSKVSASDDTVPETSGSPVSLGGVPLAGQRGLFTTYEALIRDAFQPQYWNSDLIIEYQPDGGSSVIPRPAGMLADNQFTQMEANFSFFFGLAIQMYESTLVADDTPFDRYLDGDPDALTAEQLAGFDIFLDRGRCAQCHTGPELTEAALRGIELMFMASPGRAFYDRGFINIGVRPTAEDIGQGGTAPFINPVTGQPYPLSLTRLAMLKRAGQLPPAVSLFVPDLPFGTGSPDPNRVSVDGSLKVPGLRNVELTGPYFHNGGQATLRQVVDFYDRGGDFFDENFDNMHAFIGELELSEDDKNALVSFLLSLTDERVRQEQAPFDHPQLFVPVGQLGDESAIVGSSGVLRDGFRENEEVLEIPAVGVGGRVEALLPPLGTFLNLSPFQP